MARAFADYFLSDTIQKVSLHYRVPICIQPRWHNRIFRKVFTMTEERLCKKKTLGRAEQNSNGYFLAVTLVSSSEEASPMYIVFVIIETAYICICVCSFLRTSSFRGGHLRVSDPVQCSWSWLGCPQWLPWFLPHWPSPQGNTTSLRLREPSVDVVLVFIASCVAGCREKIMVAPCLKECRAWSGRWKLLLDSKPSYQSSQAYVQTLEGYPFCCDKYLRIAFDANHIHTGNRRGLDRCIKSSGLIVVMRIQMPDAVWNDSCPQRRSRFW